MVSIKLFTMFFLQSPIVVTLYGTKLLSNIEEKHPPGGHGKCVSRKQKKGNKFSILLALVKFSFHLFTVQIFASKSMKIFRPWSDGAYINLFIRRISMFLILSQYI